MDDDDGDGDGDRRRNPPPLPSNYVTLVQLQQRWLQEKQRNQREKQEEEERKQKIQKHQEEEEEKRKRQEEEQPPQQKQEQGNTSFPRRNLRPPLKVSMQYRAIGVSDGESKSTDDLKKKKKKKKKMYNKGKNWKPRADEDLIGGKDRLLPETEDVVVDKIPVVSTERRDYCEKVGVKKRGKARVEKDPTQCRENFLLENEVQAENVVVPVVSSCEKEIGKKCEEGVSASGGKRGDGRYPRGVKNRGSPRVGEDQTIGREQLLPNKEVEGENVAVVLTKRDGGFEGSGKGLAVNGGRVWEEGLITIGREEQVVPKKEVEAEEGVPASGGKRLNVRYPRGVKNRGNPRVEESLTIGREQLSPNKEVEAENVAVVSTKRDGEFEGSGKGLAVNGGRVREEDIMTIGREGQALPKKEVEAEEGVPASGGKRGNGRYPRGVKNRVKPRVEEALTIGREQLSPNKEVEAENVAVVSTKRDGGFVGSGKGLAVNGGRVWEKKVVGVDGPEAVLGKFEGLSVKGGGGGGGHVKNARYLNGGPRRYERGYGSGNSLRLQRPRDSNFVWIRKEEGDTLDANVAGV